MNHPNLDIDEIKAEIKILLNQDSSLKSTELLQRLKQKFPGTKHWSSQKVTAVKKQLALPAPKPASKPTPKSNLSKVDRSPALTTPVHENIPNTIENLVQFKSLRTGKVYTQNSGDPPIYFTINGSDTKYLFQDFVNLVERHCDKLVEIDAATTPEDVPITKVTPKDLGFPKG